MNFETGEISSSKSENQFELSKKDQEIIIEIESKLNNLKEKNPTIYQKLNEIIDTSTLKNLADFPPKQRMAHLQSIADLIEEEAGNLDNMPLKNVLLAILMLLQALSFTPPTVYAGENTNEKSKRPTYGDMVKKERERREKEIKEFLKKPKDSNVFGELNLQEHLKKKKSSLIRELNIDGKKYNFGLVNEKHGDFGTYKTLAVIDQKGKHCFPLRFSTWGQFIDGCYIGKLVDKNPSLVVWYKDVSHIGKERIRAEFYRWDAKCGKFVIFNYDITDQEFDTDTNYEGQEIIKKLLSKDKSRFRQLYEKLCQKYPEEQFRIYRVQRGDTDINHFIFTSKSEKEFHVLETNEGKIIISPK